MSSPDDRGGDGGPTPGGLRFLQILVTLLTVVMIAGMITLVGLIWHGYSSARAPLPDTLTLPSGAVATAFTQGADWYAVVTEADEILIFDRASGDLRQRIAILPAE